MRSKAKLLCTESDVNRNYVMRKKLNAREE